MYLGIDLGTSNSAIVGNINGVLKLFKTSDGRDVLPSAIYIDRRGNKFVGKKAQDQALLSPENVAQGFKRLMGTATPFKFAGADVELTPEDASADVLRTLLTQAQTEAGDQTVVGAVITTPAAFNQMQSEATIRAASAAGLPNVGLIQEPVAAALASLENATNKDGIFLVYDLGGGTFDVALVQSTRGSVAILAHAGVNMLGGRDFDRTIVNSLVRPWLLENYQLPADFQREPKYRRLMRLAAMKAEDAKIELSTRETTQIFVGEEEARAEDLAGREMFVEVSLSRQQLEELTRDRIDESIRLCRDILEENGLSHDDVDRLVFIGGPSKMPSIRDRVPRELGIAADLGTDPMTAVARGAAIFAESRTWDNSGGTTRKSARGSLATTGQVAVSYEFEARTTDNEARIRATLKSDVQGVRISASNEDMWQSGEMSLDGQKVFKVPLPKIGENRIAIKVIDSAGLVVSSASSEIIVTKINASAAGIPATQTIAVKTRNGDGHFARNELKALFEKGTILPTSGVEKFRAAQNLRGGSDDSLTIEIFEKTPGVPEPELNLFIGSYIVNATSLDNDVAIRKGDEVYVHWNVDDNMLLNCTIELPTAGLKLENEKFYSPSLGHKNYGGDAGLQIAEAALEAAQSDIDGISTALEGAAGSELASLRRRIERQKSELVRADGADVCRAIDEEARHIRQEVSRLRHSPDHRSKILAADIDRGTDILAQLIPNADAQTIDRVKQLTDTAEQSLIRGDLDTAERAVDDMRSLISSAIVQEPAYIVASFERAASERYLAIDPALHDKASSAGRAALDRNDIDGVRSATIELYRNRAEAEAPTADLASLSGLMGH
jgi:molecular chaperone DnaK